ncbi:MAG: T9SS type A sorting domain-containing protein [Bacteroidetes bacterium]|nr:T9SS type A sorting domain-containing protein [Bacteroidota bacterium]
MNIRQLALVIVVSLLFGSLDLVAHAQEKSNCGGGVDAVNTNSGRDFLLIFMANEEADYETGAPSNYQDVYIASLDDSATVTVSCPGTGFSKVLNLPIRTGVTVRVDSTPALDCVVNSDEVVDNMVVSVVSDNPIICYGMNHKSETADAFLVLPKQVAGTAYMVMSYTNCSSTEIFGTDIHNLKPSEFAFGAFDNGTTVTFTPTAMTENGSPAGVPITVSLDKGKCYQVRASLSADPLADLTGTVITSNNPIAVFGGHRRAEVPHDYVFYEGSGAPRSSRDHLAEQMPPIATWGTAFIARNFLPRTIGDLMRVMSSADGNVVTINGVPWGKPMKAGEFRDTMIVYKNAPVDNVYCVQTSMPSLVGMYAHTADSSNGTGDPFFAIVPPLDQAYPDLTYFMSSDPVYSLNSLIVTTEQQNVGTLKSNVFINNIAIPSASFLSLPTTLSPDGHTAKSYAIATIAQSPGMSRITVPNTGSGGGVTILGYGFGVVDSYGYTAGGLFKPKTGIWKEIDAQNLPFPGPPMQPTFTIRNILGDETVWLDSIVIEYTSNPEGIAVRSVNVPMKNFGILPVAGKQRITLAPETTPSRRITGIARLYHHTGLWFDLYPLAVDFTIEPGTTSGVHTSTTDAEAYAIAFPNPVTGSNTTLEYSLPHSAHASVRIFDALGRQMLTAFDGQQEAGRNSVHIDARALTTGTYVYEISAPEAGISARGHFSIVH